jgi:dihydropyrimidinase
MENHKYDLIIKNGYVVSAESIEKKDIGIRDEKITFVGKINFYECEKVIDANGKYVLPGIIDGHMHVEAPMGGGLTSADDYYTQSISAAFGGVTTFMDFTNTNRGDSLIESMERRLEQMKKSAIDYALHGRIVEATDEILAEIKEFVDKGCPSFKMYMTYREDGFLADDDTMLKVFDAARDADALCLLHCESNPILEYLDRKYEEKGLRQWWVHAATKPIACEVEAANRAITFSKIVGNSILLVHTTNGEVLKLANKAQSEGSPVYIETCPHYLTMFEDLYNKEDGHLAICSPPLRKKENSDELWVGLNDGTINVTGSDDCAFTREAKEKYLKRDSQGNLIQDYKKVVSGMSGIEMRLPILITEGVCKNRITINKLVELTSTNLAKLYGMYPQKGIIQEGSDADIVIIDMEKEKIVTAKSLHNSVGYTVYEGMKVKGVPDTTILRGDVIVDNNEFYGKKYDGRFVKRTINNNILKGFGL